MPLMHEYMHEGTSEQWQPDQRAENVSAVLSEQELRRR
jgi:hypothetical protein